ncbi:MAG: ral nucleoside transport system permease protein [Actinomycetota bacterium]|jgi:simple sugar transport system permease protein|nr:ral nucleoside transport system permease protein [Actinomycetota bacterium]
MSSARATTTTEQPPAKRRSSRLSLPVVLLGVAGALVLFSLVRVISGANDLTSSGTIGAALSLAVPIGMAGLGGLWAERAGVVNIGLEGMMILGTWGAGWAGYQYGPWTGVLVGVGMGAAGGLLHAIATVTFGVDHIVSGVAINILGLGVTQFLSVTAFEGVRGGGESQSPPIANIREVSLPGIGEPLLELERKHLFLLSDLAGILRGITVGVSLLTVVAILLLIGSFYVLWRTPFGLRLRACGESPVAAESLGVNVYLMKYIAVIASGGFAGIGGAFLAIVAGNGYREGQTAGRGFIGLAAMIFGNWRPGGLAMGAGLFGYTDALQLRSGVESVHALLLLVGVALLLVAVWLASKQKLVSSAICAVLGAAFLVWYVRTDEVPGDFTTMTPYLATLLVLALASQRLRMPAADGLPYRRGQGG